MVKYTDSHLVGIKVPIGVYEDILKIMKENNAWLSPQGFILEAVREKIEKWKKEHGAYGAPSRIQK